MVAVSGRNIEMEDDEECKTERVAEIKGWEDEPPSEKVSINSVCSWAAN